MGVTFSWLLVQYGFSSQNPAVLTDSCCAVQLIIENITFERKMLYVYSV